MKQKNTPAPHLSHPSLCLKHIALLFGTFCKSFTALCLFCRQNADCNGTATAKTTSPKQSVLLTLCNRYFLPRKKLLFMPSLTASCRLTRYLLFSCCFQKKSVSKTPEFPFIMSELSIQTTPITPTIQTTPITPTIQTTPITPTIQTTPITPTTQTTPITPTIQTTPITPTINNKKKCHRTICPMA